LGRRSTPRLLRFAYATRLKKGEKQRAFSRKEIATQGMEGYWRIGHFVSLGL
jgi:hypothetical protein